MSDGDAPRRAAGEPRFLADAMLGRLARWLRLLGYDVLYDTALDDAEIVRVALREGRVVLTRDAGLVARRSLRRPPGRALLVGSERLADQLREVLDAFALEADAARLFTRCAACNGRVVEKDGTELAGRIPPYVLRTSPRFAACDRCGKEYWEGTHRERARRQLARLLADGAPGD